MFYPFSDYETSKKYVFEINTNTYKYNGKNELKNEDFAKYICDKFEILNIYEIFRFNKNGEEVEFLDDLKMDELKTVFEKNECVVCKRNEEEINFTFKVGETYDFNDFKVLTDYRHRDGFVIFKNIDCAKNYIFSLDIKNKIYPFQGELISYFDNGSIQSKSNYLNGKYNGEQIRYYENGNIDHIQNFVNGIFHGISIWYFENQNILSETLYDMDKIVYRKEYWDNKNIAEEGNKDFVKVYYITGELYEHICFKTNISKIFLKDNTLISEKEFKIELQDYLKENYCSEDKINENYCPDFDSTYDLVYTKIIYEILDKEKYEKIDLRSFDEVYYESEKDFHNKLYEYNKKKCEEGKFLEVKIVMNI
jgi:antitoxin component YwqK of YwqJK toxin-antitoxin module